jgi:heparan-alpha-glucosaminide N-acetyltransferase
LTSLDAYRGLVMFLMMAEALQFCAVASARPHSAFWKFLCHQQSHAEWTGCSLHDLIQPSFSFLVGVVLPFSLASRAARGQSRRRMTIHALGRALALTLLGVLLRSINAGHANWTFEDTLSQIGMGYGILFVLGFRPPREHWMVFGAILLGYWAAFALYPAPSNFDYASVGVPSDWPFLKSGFAAHWNKNSNLAWAFDRWFLNFFPRAHPFEYNEGGYATLSFIPTLGTMILGLIAGNIIRDQRPSWAKVRWFVVAGALGLGLGLLAERCGICPIVKRIWTPSWTLYSGGWCFLFLAGFYAVIEILGFKRWAFPLVVIGSNSIAAYCVANISDTVIDRLSGHFGWDTGPAASGPYAPLLDGAIGLLFIWLVLYALHRRKIFLRI